MLFKKSFNVKYLLNLFSIPLVLVSLLLESLDLLLYSTYYSFILPFLRLHHRLTKTTPHDIVAGCCNYFDMFLCTYHFAFFDKSPTWSRSMASRSKSEVPPVSVSAPASSASVCASSSSEISSNSSACSAKRLPEKSPTSSTPSSKWETGSNSDVSLHQPRIWNARQESGIILQ